MGLLDSGYLCFRKSRVAPDGAWADRSGSGFHAVRCFFRVGRVEAGPASEDHRVLPGQMGERAAGGVCVRGDRRLLHPALSRFRAEPGPVLLYR